MPFPDPAFPRHQRLWMLVEPTLPPGELAHDRHHLERVYRWALRLAPDDLRTLNNLAWLWATCPKDELRDGPRALEFARKACEQTGWEQPGYLDTLAVACAECGQFDEAVRWQAKAVELATQAEKADYQSRLDLYKAGRPYREAQGS